MPMNAAQKAKLEELVNEIIKQRQYGIANTDQALVCLLRGLNPYITGTWRAVVQKNWGNQRASIDFNSYWGGKGSGVGIDADNFEQSYYGDPLGLLAGNVLKDMRNGQITEEDLIEYYQQNGLAPLTPQPGAAPSPKQGPQVKPTTPRPVPPGTKTNPN